MSSYMLSLLVLVFGSCCLLVIGLHHALNVKNREISSRLKKIQDQAARPEQTGNGSHAPSLSVLSSVSRAAVKFSLFNRMARIVDKNLAGADIPLKTEEYMVLTAGISVFAGAFVSLFFLDIYRGVVTSALAVVFSALWVKAAKVRRLNKFNSQIGDALVIMSNALRSGFSFLQAMDMVRKELPNPIAREFGRTFQEMNLGTPTEEALENLNARVGSEDLELVITAVLIQRQVGGNLAEIMDNIANTIRERVRIKGEIKTLTAQGRISGIIIGILPIILAGVLSVISPEYLEPLVTHPIGRGMLVSALIMEVVGLLLIRKIVDIKV